MKRALFVLLCALFFVVASQPTARADPARQAGRAYMLYRISIQGDVGGSAFQRSGELFITEAFTESGEKLQNLNDVLLLSGQPGTSPQLGAINLATNTFFFGHDSSTRPTINLARVSYNEQATGLTVQILPDNPGGALRNVFTASPGWFSNVYTVSGGTLRIEFANDLSSVSGRVELIGKGFIFFLNAPYRATFKGELIQQGEF